MVRSRAKPFLNKWELSSVPTWSLCCASLISVLVSCLSDASYEEEQSLDPAFMENNMQLDDDAVGVEPTDVNIEDMSG